jgi:hypothetical protein
MIRRFRTALFSLLGLALAITAAPARAADSGSAGAGTLLVQADKPADSGVEPQQAGKKKKPASQGAEEEEPDCD